MRKTHTIAFLIVAAALAVAGPASAQTKEVYLRAGVTTLTLPDLSSVQMWGYAQDTGAAVEDGVVQVPGPVIALAPTDTTLLIHLKNRISEPTSLVVPGLKAVNPGAPTRAADGRALSLTGEVAPGASGDYTFAAKPGSFLYHSGSHVQVQVQMGLHGAIKRDASANVPYAGAAAYDQDLVLVLSEIDPALHQAIAGGDYGPGKTVSSTIQYQPRYFLVNGKPFASGDAPLPIASAGRKTLLRLYNATISTRVPTVLNQVLSVLSDSGNKLPYPKQQYSVLLPALQTADAVLSPSVAGTVPVFDRSLGLSNGAGLEGGITARLSVGAAVAAASSPRILNKRFAPASRPSLAPSLRFQKFRGARPLVPVR